MLKYFLYLLTKRMPLIIGITLIMITAMFMFIFSVAFSVEITDYFNRSRLGKQYGMFFTYYLALGVLCVIVPMIEFGFRCKKRSIFKLYSFPISRRKLYLAIYLVGLIEILVPFLITFAIFPKIFAFTPYFNKYWQLYLLAIIPTIILLYSYCVFFFTRASSLINSIIIELLALYGLTAICSSINAVIQLKTNIDCPSSFFLGLSFVSYFFNDLCNGVVLKEAFYWNLVTIILFAVVSIFAFVLFIVTSEQTTGEDVTSEPDSWFGYKSLIPVLGILCSTSWWMLIVTIPATIILYVLYLKKKREKRKYCVIIPVVVLLEVIFCFSSMGIVYFG